jgi:hypothetical protein
MEIATHREPLLKFASMTKWRASRAFENFKWKTVKSAELKLVRGNPALRSLELQNRIDPGSLAILPIV